MSVEAPARGRSWLALGALSVVTVIWGITFSWMKEAQDAARATLGPDHSTETIALYMGLRFGLAALVMALVPRARAKADRAAWRGGFVLGALLYAGFLVQMLGLEEITPAVSAFLTSLYVLFTAAITAWNVRARPGLALLVGALLATLGAGLIRGRPQIDLRTGELLTVVSAVVFAVHILATDKVTRASDALAATLTTFVWVALFSALTLGATQLLGAGSDAQHLQELMCSRAWLEPLVLGAIFATVIALSLMNLFQKQIDPLRAAIVYAIEPIWALVFGVWRGHDVLSSWLWSAAACCSRATSSRSSARGANRSPDQRRRGGSALRCLWKRAWWKCIAGPISMYANPGLEAQTEFIPRTAIVSTIASSATAARITCEPMSRRVCRRSSASRRSSSACASPSRLSCSRTALRNRKPKL